MHMYHRNGCLCTATRGDRRSFQSSHPDNINSSSNDCKLRWKSFTLSLHTISCENKLKTQIRPSALLRSISRKRLFLMSVICLPCFMFALLTHTHTHTHTHTRTRDRLRKLQRVQQPWRNPRHANGMLGRTAAVPKLIINQIKRNSKNLTMLDTYELDLCANSQLKTLQRRVTTPI